jgi:plastocyanin
LVRRLLAVVLLAFCARPHAAEVSVTLVDAAGKPLVDAVVFDANESGRRTPGRAARATIVQHNRVFQPFVTVVQTGTAISFPNDDAIMHHVYSFSAAKRFEIKLYKGTPADPIVFDKPGVVALGCNVHDWMLAYVLVVDTPAFAKSEADGVARLQNLEPGTHRLMVWYPGMRAPSLLREVSLPAQQPLTFTHRLDVPTKTQPKAPPFDPKVYSRRRDPPGLFAGRDLRVDLPDLHHQLVVAEQEGMLHPHIELADVARLREHGDPLGVGVRLELADRQLHRTLGGGEFLPQLAQLGGAAVGAVELAADPLHDRRPVVVAHQHIDVAGGDRLETVPDFRLVQRPGGGRCAEQQQGPSQSAYGSCHRHSAVE